MLLWCVVVFCLFVTEKSAAATFFISSSSGNDSNLGTSQNGPWKHAPGMRGCAALCAAYIPLPGDQFIFKGGDTWHNDSLPWIWSWGGAPGNPVFIGVLDNDHTWFTGSSWTRPRLDGDNPLSTTPVPSCAQQVSGNAPFFDVGAISWIVFDNFEFRGLCWQFSAGGTPGTQPPYGTDAYMDLSYSSTTNGNNVYKNLFFHGWTHKAFNCSLTGQWLTGVCDTSVAVFGPTQEYGGGDLWDTVLIDGSDSDSTTFGGFVGSSVYEIKNSVIRYNSQGFVSDNTHSIHDNIFEHIVESSDNVKHSNVIKLNSEYIPATHNYIYNNVIRHVATAETVDVCPQSQTGPDYYYNNIVYDVAQQPWDFTSLCGGSAFFYNNTFAANGQGIGDNSGASWAGTLVNNLLINTPLAGTPSGGNTNPIVLSDQQATDRGITFTNDYRLMGLACNGLSPCPIGTGANLTSFCSNTPSSTLCSDSSDGATLTVRARPSNTSNNWDVGAFQFRVTPPPPTGLTAVVHQQ